MLIWSRSGRFAVWSLAALLIGVIFLAPLAIILVASLADQWNGVLPNGFTLEHYLRARSGASGEAVIASLVTGVLASLFALLSGAWAALALRAQGEAWSRSLGLLFFVPSAVPSVSVGLGLLVAFSQRPLLLNGTTLYGTTSAGGSKGNGTVFQIDTSGNNYSRIYDFKNPPDGANLIDNVILLDNTLYGMTEAGGLCGNGAIFALQLP